MRPTMPTWSSCTIGTIQNRVCTSLTVHSRSRDTRPIWTWLTCTPNRLYGMRRMSARMWPGRGFQYWEGPRTGTWTSARMTTEDGLGRNLICIGRCCWIHILHRSKLRWVWICRQHTDGVSCESDVHVRSQSWGRRINVTERWYSLHFVNNHLSHLPA